MSKQINAYVKVKKGESIDSALKRFNSQVMNSNVLTELRDREYYLKPGEKKRLRRLRARTRNRE